MSVWSCGEIHSSATEDAAHGSASHIAEFADGQQTRRLCFGRRTNCGHVANGGDVDILPVMVIDEVPAVSTSYVPTRWALAVAAELERLKRNGVRAALVHLEDAPRVRSVGISRPIDL